MINHEIEFVEDTRTCIIKVVGEHRRPKDSHELLRIAGGFAKENDCARFLFDMREAIIISTLTGAFKTATEPEKQGFSRFFRIGAVYPKLDETHQFLENVGVNRGASNFRVFSDYDKAYEWVTTPNETY